MTAPLSLSAIREQLAWITRGPWEERVNDDGEVDSVWHDGDHAFPIGMCADPNCGTEAIYEPYDAAFIAAAPSTVARLLGALERVEALVERSESHGNLYVFVDDISAAITGEG